MNWFTCKNVIRSIDFPKAFLEFKACRGHFYYNLEVVKPDVNEIAFLGETDVIRKNIRRETDVLLIFLRRCGAQDNTISVQSSSQVFGKGELVENR